FTQEETTYYDGLIASNYSTNKKAMEQNGVGEESYTAYMYNSLKANTLFTEKYFDAVTNSEVSTYLDENYVSIKYVSFPYMNTATYTFLSTEEIEQQTAAANKALEEIKKGDVTLEDIVAKYLPDAYKLVGNETQDFSTPASLVSSTKLQKGQTSTTFTTEFIDGLFDAKVDEYGLYEGGAGVMVYQKVANYTSDDELTYYKSSLLTDIKGEEFEAYLAETFGGYAVTENSSAVRKFSPKNVVLA
ncbi:MAG: hypothetical protein PHG02_06095, partial [Oscillospiraceae bacterium]|nr:hypothetical protein [Oscillospiraceae bacterium]